MKPATIALLVVLVLVAAVVGLFGWQNLPTRVDLVLSLGPAGSWYLGRALPVPYLLGAAFLLGFLVAGVWLGARAGVAGRRARAAQQQLAALQDEVAWSRREAGSPVAKGAKAAAASPRPVPVAAAAPAPIAQPAAAPAPAPDAPAFPAKSAPAKPATPPPAADPPDFDDLI